ncbi:MAG: molybdopterin converting factor [Novosphingobium sp. 63-713]|uniref:molybdenum cofactor biosynthesis protein MoaE n=1 Tax=unclassified Novosphingobium TaxID=2644732 RepID=UPI00086A85FC|nr:MULTISPECIES: molybdenum cofactor biosynthesis protein MoaE [unclassified Novosphingobium]MBN9145081.1 molybdenum cofactor biosynthesis protein MoaE [Novosphingobium sp.]MDR6709003.1 molybdopterin synthase catalytic subunit [Novosphingobium sp. 1748]ODU70963.1 MAG: molybdopterin converting factor [Novosphingobium sp. SCN 66-18]OJX89914.1 MAG: molybdopterin converting factor [Novosphingobium sp. 63-713]
MIEVRLIEQAFDAGDAIRDFAAAHPQSGGVVSFLGQVRADSSQQGDDVEALELQHYAPLTLPGMEALARDVLGRWALDGLLIWHRVGEMAPGDPIVLVAAASRHRRDAFAAADFAMDHLKSESWFWKREKRAGQWAWVEPREQDYADLARWGQIGN